MDEGISSLHRVETIVMQRLGEAEVVTIQIFSAGETAAQLSSHVVSIFIKSSTKNR